MAGTLGAVSSPEAIASAESGTRRGHARVAAALAGLRSRPEVPLLALVATIGWLVVSARSGWADATSTAAAHVGAHSWWAFLWGATDTGGSAAVGLPAPTWLQALSVALLGSGQWSVLVPQALLVGASVAVAHDALARILPRFVAACAALILVASPLLTVVATSSGPGALVVATGTLAPVAAWRAGRTGRARWAVACGAAVGLGLLSVGLWVALLAPTVVLAVLLSAHDGRGRVRALVVASLTAACSVLWWLGALALAGSSAPWGLAQQVRDLLVAPLQMLRDGALAGSAAWLSALDTGTDSDLGWSLALLGAFAAALGAGGALCLRWGRRGAVAGEGADEDREPRSLLTRGLVVVGVWAVTLSLALVALVAVRGEEDIAVVGTLTSTAAALVVPYVFLASLGWAAVRTRRVACRRSLGHVVSGIALLLLFLVPSLAAGVGMPGSSPATAGEDGGVVVPDATLISMAQTDADSFTWVAAAVGGEEAGTLQLAFGAPVMTVGGVGATRDVPSLARFQDLVESGAVHYWVEPADASTGGGVSTAAGRIGAWVRSTATCSEVGTATVCDLSGLAR